MMNRGDWVTVDTADAGELSGMLVTVEDEGAEDGSRHAAVALFDPAAGNVRYWHGPVYSSRSKASEMRDLHGRPDGAYVTDDSKDEQKESATGKGAQKPAQGRS